MKELTLEDIKFWLEELYPTTIIHDRYGGTYSGAEWLAFPLQHDDVPEEVSGEDMECAHFWRTTVYPIGKGSSPVEALIDLRNLLEFTVALSKGLVEIIKDKNVN